MRRFAEGCILSTSSLSLFPTLSQPQPSVIYIITYSCTSTVYRCTTLHTLPPWVKSSAAALISRLPDILPASHAQLGVDPCAAISAAIMDAGRDTSLFAVHVALAQRRWPMAIGALLLSVLMLTRPGYYTMLDTP